MMRCSFFIFFFFLTQAVSAMDSETLRSTTSNLVHSYGETSLKPIHTQDLYKFARKPKDESSLALLMSPIRNDDTVLISKKDGTVSRFSLNNKQEELLIRHHYGGYIPMVAAAHKEGSLIVFSAVNYDENNSSKSEYFRWQNGFVKERKFRALQAVAIDSHGDLLIAADQDQNQNVFVIDLN